MRSIHVALAASVAFAACAVPLPAAARPLEVRVVVVTTFEPGRPADDAPGEFAAWAQRFPLGETLPFPDGQRHLRWDSARHVLGVVTGEGAERGAASIMALGLDPRFDLRKAYWVVAAIAGVDPAAGSVGSAAWARFVVNGDLGYELDPRDVPPAWPTGIVPFGTAAPFGHRTLSENSIRGQMAYALDPSLVAWAYRTTRGVALPDDATLQHERAAYSAWPAATRPPFVFVGDDLAADRFWIGARMTAWAERWTAYWTEGRARFAMTGEEDAGIMQSLTMLAPTGRIALDRVLVLRTASDYCEPPPGTSAVRSLERDEGLAGIGGYSAFREALDAAYRVGAPVVDALARHWDRYSDRVP